MAIGTPAVFPIKYLQLGSTNVSSALSSGVLTVTYDRVDAEHTMGRSSLRTLLTNKYSWELECTLEIDGYGAGTLNNIIAGALPSPLGSGTGTLAIEIRQSSGNVSATNPKYTGNVLVESYKPFGDSGGMEVATITVTWMGTGDLTVATSG